MAKCPTCESPDPKKHPAAQFEGEVMLCRDSFHKPRPEELRECFAIMEREQEEDRTDFIRRSSSTKATK